MVNDFRVAVVRCLLQRVSQVRRGFEEIIQLACTAAK